MKKTFTDLQTGLETMQILHFAHEKLSELRQVLKFFEEDYFTLVGEYFGELKVVAKAHRREIINGSEHFIAAWECQCECGNKVNVDHVKLITKATTNCGDESHGVELVEL